MKNKPRIYITKKKQIIKRNIELELTEKVYIGGGVGLHLTVTDVGESKEDIPTNNELGIEDNED